MRTWILGLFLLIFACSAAAVELRVPSDYRTIQAAIDAARAGDIVRIAQGLYRENLIIDAKVHLAVRSDVMPAVDLSRPCWDLAAEHDGCVLLGTIQILSCVQITVEGLTVISPASAIYIDGSKSCFASDIAIRSCNLIAEHGGAIALGEYYRYLSVACTNAHLLDGESGMIDSVGAPHLRDVLLTCSRSTSRLSTTNLSEDAPAEVVVAIIDSGIDRTIPEIACRLWRNPLEIPENGFDDDGNGFVDDVFGWDFRDGDADSLVGSPLHWHGTFVAGRLIDAVESRLPTDAPCTVRLMDVRFLDEEALFYTSDWDLLAEAIDYAVAMGARIVNLSLYATRLPPAAVREAIQRATTRGALVVAIAGNDAAQLGPIADWNEVFTVGSVDRNLEQAWFSNVGEELDAVSPGVDVLSLIPGGAARTSSGTSFSAPRVAGLAALHVAQQPELTPAELAKILIDAATDLGIPGHDIRTGWGLIE